MHVTQTMAADDAAVIHASSETYVGTVLTLAGSRDGTSSYKLMEVFTDYNGDGQGQLNVFEVSGNGAVTVGSGPLLVTGSGGQDIQSGGLTVSGGGLQVTDGGATISAGGLAITGGSLDVSTSISMSSSSNGAPLAQLQSTSVTFDDTVLQL